MSATKHQGAGLNPEQLDITQGNLLKVLIDQSYLNIIPVVEPSVFSGDPLTYAEWKKSFTTLGYMLLNSADANNDAKKLLEERFDYPFVLANAYRSKLDNWYVIYDTNHEGLQELSDYLRQCRAAMKSIPSLSVLNDCHER